MFHQSTQAAKLIERLNIRQGTTRNHAAAERPPPDVFAQCDASRLCRRLKLRPLGRRKPDLKGGGHLLGTARARHLSSLASNGGLGGLPLSKNR
ncbi:hypothetical protein Acry_3558 (plasmid) [Acidiphilium cryptum JF-5]|uniref:Uncharacterized protein n=1 Tax=Acidiphilium cryptum (strain JF-5) TaxID=349163 RepID=A5FU74_ACICJ|nr:hypothetical protein Acry_3558 [Acidiphilium cryptum JF-5]